MKARKRHNPRDPHRVATMVLLSKPIARIIRMLARDAGVSVSRIVTEMVHESLGIPVQPLSVQRRGHKRRSTGRGK